MPKAIKYCTKHNCDKLYDLIFKRYICELCKIDINKSYYLKNKEEIKENVKTYALENASQIKIIKKKYREENINVISERDKKYYFLNKNAKLEYQHSYYLENKSEILKKKLIYVEYRSYYSAKQIAIFIND